MVSTPPNQSPYYRNMTNHHGTLNGTNSMHHFVSCLVLFGDEWRVKCSRWRAADWEGAHIHKARITHGEKRIVRDFGPLLSENCTRSSFLAMTLLEDPGISILPSFPNIKQTSEPIKGPSDSTQAPSVTVKTNFNELESDRSVKTHFEIEEHPIDVVRPIKVGIIGAGLAGITAGVLLPAKLPGLDLRIYDKNADVVRQILFYVLASR